MSPMGHRRAPLALVATFGIATSFAACQTPTSMTVAVSTDVLCQELEQKSDAAIIVGHAAEDLLDLQNVASTKRCEQEGAIGEVVLLPQGDEATEVAFKIVLGVGRPTSDCGLVDTGQPEGVWAGCIVARRRLAFLDGEALVVEVPLYERCIGVPCGDGEGESPFTTCNSKGECVPADLDPEDCLVGCGEEQLQGTVTNAATTTGAGGAGGDGGASSTSDATSTGDGATTSSTGGGGEGGGAPGCVEGTACLLEGGGEGVCDAAGVCVVCVEDTDCPITPADSVCAVPECVLGVCGRSNLPASTPCVGEPGVCDGSGTCVECILAADCASAVDMCVDNFCQPASCSNGNLDPGETDADCGGAECAPCANGLSCDLGSPPVADDDSCLSGSCQDDPNSSGFVCAPCATDGQCGIDEFCDLQTGTCEALLEDGDDCSSDASCANGACVFEPGSAVGTCCATACDGACETCSTGVCEPRLAGSSCGDPTCQGDTVIDPTCNGGGDCVATPIDCDSSEVCVDGACEPEAGTTASTSGPSGVGGGGDGGSTTSSTIVSGVGGADGAGGAPTTSTGPQGCFVDADCDFIDPLCSCSMGLCLCPQLPSGGGGP